jgi:hypothetical protein
LAPYAATFLLAVAIGLALAGCATTGQDRLEPGFDSADAGLRVVDGFVEVQFCDSYDVNQVIIGEYDAAVAPYFEPVIGVESPPRIEAGQEFSLSGQNFVTARQAEFAVGNEVEVVLLTDNGMVSSRFLIEEPGLPSELWLLPDGLLLVDPCA